jgi:iron complex transport system substrate-binding protein
MCCLQRQSPVEENMPRIVSLIASATEIVHALGMEEFLVGRSHECDYPPSVLSLPVCTAPRFPVAGSSREIDRRVKDQLREAISVYEVNETELKRLLPTHILTQSQCEVCAVSLRDVETALQCQLVSRPRVVSLQPNSLVDIWSDIQGVADSLGFSSRGQEVVQTLQSRLRSISDRIPKGRGGPAVACIEWLEPLMACGNWMPELVELAGAVNLFGEAGRHSPWMTWDDLVHRDPEVIMVMPCGFDLKRTHGEMYWLTQRQEWSRLRAVKNRQIYLTDGNQYFNRPGPRIVETLQILAEVFYPERFDPALKGDGWIRWEEG